MLNVIDALNDKIENLVDSVNTAAENTVEKINNFFEKVVDFLGWVCHNDFVVYERYKVKFFRRDDG